MTEAGSRSRVDDDDSVAPMLESSDGGPPVTMAGFN